VRCADEEDLPEVEGNHSKLLRYQKGSRWQGIETQEYKAEGTAEFKRASGPAAHCAVLALPFTLPWRSTSSCRENLPRSDHP